RAERALARHPDIPLPASLGAAILASMGERERALRWAARALEIAPDEALTQFNVACVYALLGQADRAIELLEQWVRRANRATRKWIVIDSDFDRIRDHPRFQQLLAQHQ